MQPRHALLKLFRLDEGAIAELRTRCNPDPVITQDAQMAPRRSPRERAQPEAMGQRKDRFLHSHARHHARKLWRNTLRQLSEVGERRVAQTPPDPHRLHCLWHIVHPKQLHARLQCFHRQRQTAAEPLVRRGLV